MQFSSSVFLILFLPLTVAAYKISGRISFRLKNMILLFASLLFYAWGEPLFVFILIISIIVNYYLGLLIGSDKHRKVFLYISVLMNIGILFIFKYLSFLSVELSRVLPVMRVNIALPIGISFYTFQIMSYIIDVYRKDVPPQKSLLDLALYISMFPQLVAGPIVRYSNIKDELNCREETPVLFCHGTHRFVIGLAKKVLVADYLGGIADKIFSESSFFTVPLVTAWIGAIAYTFEIYYDFSGYSDMAIGLGECFGFHLPENFNYPYSSCSIQEFWKKWHISLTDWFRDYVYIPLGGNRVSSRRNVFNLFIVWLLTGIWHGADWTFVIWGMYYFIIQLLEKRTSILTKIPRWVGHILTMIIVTVGWVIFKASSIHDAAVFLSSMFNLENVAFDVNSILYIKSSLIVFIIAYIASFPIIGYIKRKSSRTMLRIYDYLTFPCTILLLCLCLLVIINGSYSPFIYFTF